MENNQIWDAIDSRLIGAKRGSKGFLQINCPMCQMMGTSKDTRKRCGIKNSIDTIGINCFNCGFKTKYTVGEQLSRKMQSFMEELGIASTEVSRLQYWAWQIYKQNIPSNIEFKPKFTKPIFKKSSLPENSMSIAVLAQENFKYPKFLQAANYVLERQHSANPNNLYWSPEYEDYIIIPLLQNGNIVGYTARATIENIPKYNNISIPKDFLFNCDVIEKTDRKYLIIVEGIFDALSIDAVSTMGARLNKFQIDWLNNSPLTKILVPDKDDTGKRQIDIAVENNWYVSLPSAGVDRLWHRDIKDVDDAVKKYGKLWTVHSILKNRKNNKIDIESDKELIYQTN
jgi:hypothetical protein